MTILDRLLGHDAWTTRQLLLRRCELSDEQLNNRFEIGNRSLAGTFEHLIACMECPTDLLLGRKTREYFLATKDSRDDESIDGMLKRLPFVAKDFAEVAVRVDRDDAADEMVVNPETGNRRSRGGAIAHIITHSVHHQAQIIHIFEQMGLPNVIEGDALGWGWDDGASCGGRVTG